MGLFFLEGFMAQKIVGVFFVLVLYHEIFLSCNVII
jgi:hypothetical protein